MYMPMPHMLYAPTPMAYAYDPDASAYVYVPMPSFGLDTLVLQSLVIQGHQDQDTKTKIPRPNNQPI